MVRGGVGGGGQKKKRADIQRAFRDYNILYLRLICIFNSLIKARAAAVTGAQLQEVVSYPSLILTLHPCSRTLPSKPWVWRTSLLVRLCVRLVCRFMTRFRCIVVRPHRIEIVRHVVFGGETRCLCEHRCFVFKLAARDTENNNYSRKTVRGDTAEQVSQSNDGRSGSVCRTQLIDFLTAVFNTQKASGPGD